MPNRPVILLGQGAKDNPVLLEHLCSLGVPILTTWMAADIIPEDHPLFCGRPGVFGQRAANIIIQKATRLYVFGARLDTEQVGFRLNDFGGKAEVHVFDVEHTEFSKYIFEPWLVGRFVCHLGDLRTDEALIPLVYLDRDWLPWCRALYREFYPELIGHEREDGYIDPNYFIHQLSGQCTPEDVLSPGSSGVGGISFMQGFEFKAGQRMTCCASIGAMGMDIPMAIGACLASGRKRTICVTGDGGIMLNIQELEVVRRLNLPIKFFVYDNGGYGSIRAMQDGRFGGQRVGCDRESGFTVPDLLEVAASYKIIGFDYHDPDLIRYIWEEFFPSPDPLVVRLPVDPTYQQLPRITSSLDAEGHWHPDSFEDMTPKLNKERLNEIMSW